MQYDRGPEIHGKPRRFIKTGVFDLAATNSKSLDIASLELSGSDKDPECLKTSGGGALGIGMSVPCRTGFRADWQLG